MDSVVRYIHTLFLTVRSLTRHSHDPVFRCSHGAVSRMVRFSSRCGLSHGPVSFTVLSPSRRRGKQHGLMHSPSLCTTLSSFESLSMQFPKALRLDVSHTKVYAPHIRARLKTTAECDQIALFHPIGVYWRWTGTSDLWYQTGVSTHDPVRTGLSAIRVDATHFATQVLYYYLHGLLAQPAPPYAPDMCIDFGQMPARLEQDGLTHAASLCNTLAQPVPPHGFRA